MHSSFYPVILYSFIFFIHSFIYPVILYSLITFIILFTLSSHYSVFIHLFCYSLFIHLFIPSFNVLISNYSSCFFYLILILYLCHLFEPYRLEFFVRLSFTLLPFSFSEHDTFFLLIILYQFLHTSGRVYE